MHIKQLRYFVAVAEELHFGRAAARLHISQPPLSQQIKSLEELLGVSLFERNRRSVQLTAAGEIFLQHAYAIIQQVQTALNDIQGAAKGDIGTLRIGYSRSAMYCNKVLACIAAYREKYPNVELQFHEGSAFKQIEDITSKQIDIALVRGALPSTSKFWIKRTVSRERLVAIFPTDSPFAQNSCISLADLKHERFVFFSKAMGTALSALVEDLLSKHDIQPNVVAEVTSTQAMVGLVSAGVGISIVPETVVQSSSVTIKVCQLHETAAKVDLHIVVKKDPLMAVANFLKVLDETLKVNHGRKYLNDSQDEG